MVEQAIHGMINKSLDDRLGPAIDKALAPLMDKMKQLELSVNQYVERRRILCAKNP